MSHGSLPFSITEGHSRLAVPTAAAGLLGAILPVNAGGVQWGIRTVHSFPFITGVAKRILATLVSPLWAAILAALAFLTLRSALLRREHSLHLALQVGVVVPCCGAPWAAGAGCRGEAHIGPHPIRAAALPCCFSV